MFQELHRFIQHRSPNQDLVNSKSFSLCLQQKDELKFAGGLVDCNNLAMKNSRRSTLIDVQGSCAKIHSLLVVIKFMHIPKKQSICGLTCFIPPSESYLNTACLLDFPIHNRRNILAVLNCFILKADIHPQSLLLGFGIAEQCTRQEKILELLAGGSVEVEDGLLDLSMLYDLMGPRQLITDSAQQPCSKWCFCDAESEQSLIYPARELYLNEPVLNLVRDRSSCRENAFHPAISNLYFSKNTIPSSRRTMLVPFFERYLPRFFTRPCVTL